jgi:hypothetical protein
MDTDVGTTFSFAITSKDLRNIPSAHLPDAAPLKTAHA